MNDAEFQEIVRSVPGPDGFYKYRTEVEYLTAAYRLVQLGLTELEAVDMLTGLYWTTAECYGGC